MKAVPPSRFRQLAAWESEESALIIAVSHCWETREHPDPCGHQLGLIASSTALYHAAYAVPIWLFIDYVSLFQFKRACQDQNDSFRAAMNNMHVFYAHECSYTLRVEGLTPHALWEEHLTSDVDVYHEPSGRVEAVRLCDLTANHTPNRERGWIVFEQEPKTESTSRSSDQPLI